jgi:hypothetical protein
MRIRVKEEGGGIHPNEVVISISTRDGAERLVVHRRSVHDSALEIGYPISEDGSYYLVELPRETMRGLWRVWVSKSALRDSQERRRA